ncbi:hypothetical protein DPMN_020304 [Dreissena polymorpha]|uniref:Uncharacterized protein n=1 Tax=Dreissena polymorpha TaxID=45954 RepID=A0A9D4S8Y4_DREPO|nr:hypothetical protein DPMN_020304 [Dreissena polymorpha]
MSCLVNSNHYGGKTRWEMGYRRQSTPMGFSSAGKARKMRHNTGALFIIYTRRKADLE